jgi:hypothetical protein
MISYRATAHLMQGMLQQDRISVRLGIFLIAGLSLMLWWAMAVLASQLI